MASFKKIRKKFYNHTECLVKHRVHDNSAFNTKSFDEKLSKLKNKYS
jgi:hypothetical protein